MTLPVRLAALALGFAALCAGPLAAHPIVPGFERFPTDPAAGQLLLGELNCTSCHAADGQAKKQAPDPGCGRLRVRAGHLKKFLADPQAVKPGTTMPNLFAGDPARDAKVEALVHFLASTGTPRQTRPDLKAVIRGRDTYAKVGCAACHGPRDNAGEPGKQTFAFAVPLGDLKGKYTIPALAAFLANPLQTRPAGRMPHLLKPNEAQDVAHYLLQMLKVGLPAGKGTTRYAYFEGDWDNLPDFGKLKPKATGTGVAFELALSKRESNYGMRFEGFFPADAAGEYTFTLNSDDGSRLAHRRQEGGGQRRHSPATVEVRLHRADQGGSQGHGGLLPGRRRGGAGRRGRGPRPGPAAARARWSPPPRPSWRRSRSRRTPRRTRTPSPRTRPWWRRARPCSPPPAVRAATA